MTYKPDQYFPILMFGLFCVCLSLLQVVTGVTPWPWLLATVGVYCFLAITNSAGYHRLFCHGSYETSPFWYWFLLITGTLSCYGSSIQYSVMHINHHKYSDTDRDPHQFKSFWDIFTINYQSEEVSFANRKVIKRLMQKPGQAFVHRWYWCFPIAMTIILWLISPTVLLYFYFAPVGLVIFSAALFNYIAHNEHGPTNTAYLALFTSGEGRHKLHHDEPTRWDLREKWWHIDMGAYFIMLIKKDRHGVS